MPFTFDMFAGKTPEYTHTPRDDVGFVEILSTKEKDWSLGGDRPIGLDGEEGLSFILRVGISSEKFLY
ncbi:hypothetical protein ACE6H2_026671 [Prunus campanulata]